MYGGYLGMYIFVVPVRSRNVIVYDGKEQDYKVVTV